MRNRRVWQGGLMACALVGGLSGCGTWMHSDKQSVTIFTTPPETAVVIDDYLHFTAPGTVTLSRKGDHLAQVNKDGYEPQHGITPGLIEVTINPVSGREDSPTAPCALGWSPRSTQEWSIRLDELREQVRPFSIERNSAQEPIHR